MARPGGLILRVRPILPIVAVAILVVSTAAIVGSAGSTLGYDFHAYDAAARRLLGGERLYDPAVDVAGGFAIYLYPPPFALAILPFTVLPTSIAVSAWTLLLVAAFALGVAVLPVSTTVRWVVLLLAGLDWPFLYSVKLGQVGPILFLLFALGWRWLDRPNRLGATIALGSIVKLQPALLIAWAALTGRWRAIAAALAILVAAAVLTLAVGGIQPWLDYPALLARVSSPLTTPHNFTPGAVAWQLGAPLEAAAAVQVVTTAFALGAVVVASRLAAPDAAYLVTVVASQLVSPLLWDHYAMLLLLPVAWLLERGAWWAAAIPLVTSILAVGIVPGSIYPVVFVAAVVAPILVGWRGRAGDRGSGSPTPEPAA